MLSEFLKWTFSTTVETRKCNDPELLSLLGEDMKLFFIRGLNENLEDTGYYHLEVRYYGLKWNGVHIKLPNTATREYVKKEVITAVQILMDFANV